MSINHNGALQRNLDAAQRDLDAAQQRLAGVESQLRNSQDEVKKLREKEAMFRTIILDQAGVQKVSDDEILQGFLKLRQDIQKISRNSCFLVEASNIILSAQQMAEPFLESLYSPEAWGKLSVGDRRLRMHAVIFHELFVSILGSDCFGLEESKDKAHEGKPRKGPIEPGLRRFERLLQERGGKHSDILPLFSLCNRAPFPSSPLASLVPLSRDHTTNNAGCIVSDSVISDWRIATINCVELSGFEEATSTLTTADIFFILEPILSKNVGAMEEDALRSSILGLCKDAFKIRMMMRKSKDKYVVETIKPGTKILESEAEPVAVEGDKNSEGSDEIVYTMFGALSKHPQDKDQPVKILEKAQVVLRRK
jgi:hypothetical protein